MWQFLVGLLTGVGGIMVKNHFVDNPDKQNVQQQLNSILEENEKLRSRRKEAERLVEDLQAEISRLKKQNISNEDATDDLTDELDAEKRKNKRLMNQINDLSSQIEEYKSAIQSLELELKQLKQK